MVSPDLWSTQFAAQRLRGLTKGYWSKAPMHQWMSNTSEGAWVTPRRLNPCTYTVTPALVRRLLQAHRLENLRFRKIGNPIGQIPWFGPHLVRWPVFQILDHALSPLLGSMIVFSYTKMA